VNFSRQSALQKKFVVPARSTRPPAAVPGSMRMPQTGSVTVSGAFARAMPVTCSFFVDD
jgi:hypothetical protein